MKGQDSNWVRDEGWAPTCSFQTYPGSEQFLEPPEFCDGDALPGTEFCTEHTGIYDDERYGPFAACYEADRDKE